MDSKTSGVFYKAVVQAVLLFGSDIWFVIPFIGRTIGGFHHRLDFCLTGKQPRRGTYRIWRYPPLGELVVESGLEWVYNYVSCLHNTVAQYIIDRPIRDLCLET